VGIVHAMTLVWLARIRLNCALMDARSVLAIPLQEADMKITGRPLLLLSGAHGRIMDGGKLLWARPWHGGS
jgi:hypothetical protein